MPVATIDLAPGDLPAALEQLKRTRWELRELWFVRAWKDRFEVFDVNKDSIEFRGIGYPDASIAPLLRGVYAAFDPVTVHDPTDAEYKEFLTGRRFPWAHDRVM